MNINVGILVFDGVEELDAVGPYQVFGSAASVSSQFSVCTIAASDSTRVTAVNGLSMVAHHQMREAPDINVLVIPGGIGTKRIATQVDVLDWVRRVSTKCEIVASVCSGARITLASGLAVGKRITTHWGVIDELRADGRAAEVLDDVRFVRDGDVIHAAGVSAGIDMSLWLVGHLSRSPALAREVQKLMEYYPAPPHAWEV